MTPWIIVNLHVQVVLDATPALPEGITLMYSHTAAHQTLCLI